MSDEPLKLQWRHTWPKRGPDFIATDPNNCFSVSVCRISECSAIYREHNWQWAANHPASAMVSVFQLMGERTGFADSKGEAARLAEAAHFRFMDAIDKLGLRADLTWHHERNLEREAIWARMDRGRQVRN